MCSIMGCLGKEYDIARFKEGFEKTISRGPDASRVITFDSGVLAFHRLSIMGLTDEGMQPFEHDGSYVVCNGEIYGFDKFKKELEEDYKARCDRAEKEGK